MALFVKPSFLAAHDASFRRTPNKISPDLEDMSRSSARIKSLCSFRRFSVLIACTAHANSKSTIGGEYQRIRALNTCSASGQKLVRVVRLFTFGKPRGKK